LPEHSRHLDLALGRLGWDEQRAAELAAFPESGLTPARCVRLDRGVARTLAIEGEVRVPTRLPLAVGDWLALDGERVAHVLERRGQIVRRASGNVGAAQIVAANVDFLLIASGFDRPVKLGRIRRAVALARAGGVEPLALLTKSDLHTDSQALVDAVGSATGVDVLGVTATAGAGLERISALASPDRTMALIGESGAGKSTLVNALAGVALDTGDVRHGDAKGRHTTTWRELIPLPEGGAIIDTPGIREVGLVDTEGIDDAFADVLDVSGACRFRDCRHAGEPGCAVRAAADAGLVDPGEVDRMYAMRVEAEGAELRANEHERRRHERRFARVARDAQRRKRGRPPH
jgi:ribosome biogenesis GTPase